MAQRVFTAAVKCVTNLLISHLPSYTIRHAWYRHALGWYIGPNASIFMGQHIQIRNLQSNGRRVSIGASTVIEHGCLLSTIGGLVIGEHVRISPGVWLITQRFDADDPLDAEMYAPIVIDDYAWIGPRAMVTGGVTIGTGAVVQAGALATQDVEPHGIANGVPARVVSRRDLPRPPHALRQRPLLE